MSPSTCSSPLTVSGCTGELSGRGVCQLWARGGHPLPWPHCPLTCPPRYGAITFGNIQKSIPASFGTRAPAMVRKIAVRRAAQVSAAWPHSLWHLALTGALQGPTGLSGSFCVPQVFYNNKGYHSMPTYLNTLNNAILRANLPKSKGNPAAYGEQGGGGGHGASWHGAGPEAALPCVAGITVTNHPMNKTSASLSLDYLYVGACVGGGPLRA